jgi:hypothetical protein
VHQESVGESGISSEKEKEGKSNDEESDGAQLSMCAVTDERYVKLIHFAERLSKGWRSAVYGFFKPDVKIGYDRGRKYHFFYCAAQKCQGMKGVHGVRRFQDSKDHAATSNLRTHAIKCFGKDAVDAAFNDTQPKTHDTSIFAVFARQGQQPVKVSHCAHTKQNHGEYDILSADLLLIHNQHPYHKVVFRVQPSPSYRQRSTVRNLDEGWTTYNTYPQSNNSSSRYQDSV